MKIRALFAFSALAYAVSGCAASSDAMMARAPQAEPPAPPVLTQSVFGKDPNGSLTENDLQKVMEAALDIQLPARIGVVPLAEPFEPNGEVKISTRATASRFLSRSLSGDAHFSHVSDVSTALPHVGGLEGLRLSALPRQHRDRRRRRHRALRPVQRIGRLEGMAATGTRERAGFGLVGLFGLGER